MNKYYKFTITDLKTAFACSTPADINPRRKQQMYIAESWTDLETLDNIFDGLVPLELSLYKFLFERSWMRSSNVTECQRIVTCYARCSFRFNAIFQPCVRDCDIGD